MIGLYKTIELLNTWCERWRWVSTSQPGCIPILQMDLSWANHVCSIPFSELFGHELIQLIGSHLLLFVSTPKSRTWFAPLTDAFGPGPSVELWNSETGSLRNWTLTCNRNWITQTLRETRPCLVPQSPIEIGPTPRPLTRSLTLGAVSSVPSTGRSRGFTVTQV